MYRAPQYLFTSGYSFAHVAVNAPEAYIKPTVLERGVFLSFDDATYIYLYWKARVA